MSRIPGPSTSTKLSGSLSAKLKTLEKYQETSNERLEGCDMDGDFEWDSSKELDLSYSKFSHGPSDMKNRDSSSNSNPNSNSSAGSSDRRVQNKLQDINLEDENRLNHRQPGVRGNNKENFIKSKNLESKQMYSIDERLGENNENSPFFVPPNIPYQDKGSDSLSTPEKLILPKPRNNHSKGSRDKKVTVLSPPQSTPRHQHKRNTSVKVSLTPAQRVEKKRGFRLKNALENFQFGEMVGRGAFATVYRGINLKTNQIVAIKQILLEKDQDVQALMGEIDLLKILKHPNIVKYHGFVKTSDSLNVFLEYCAGGSLRQLYKRLNSSIPEPQIIIFVKLILHGLNYLHEQGVVHRDVKAANVLITETGDVKLADFGVATKVSSQHQSIVGTPNWMAPETVLGGEGLCTASDIWSLGATIIELFTTNPPYHDLNPMATLHAIGTDDYPPLPKNTSTMARDFLLECFQKQPSLRTTAKLLLKHKWLNQNVTESSRKSSNQFSENMRSIQNTNSPIERKSEFPTTNISANKDINPLRYYSEVMDQNWENDFSSINIDKEPHMRSHGNDNEIIMTLLDRHSRLEKYKEANNSDEEHPETTEGDNYLMPKILQNQAEDDETDDPFLNIELDNFDTNELEIQSKMEFLITKFTNRVDLCGNGNEEVANSLIKIMGKICHLVKKYPILHDVLIRDHGILSIFELLENANELPNLSKLWYYSLSTLNYLFDSNLSQFENFCLLGGIPIVTQFRSNKYDNNIKQQVVRFIRLFLKSDKALSMFISCGGLRVLSKLAEEDFETNPQFPVTSIDCLYSILTKDLSSSKSDICRNLSHYGVIFWFIVLLNRLVKLDDDQYSDTIDKVVQIIKFFGQSEVKVRINISSSDLFKLLLKIYPNLETNHKLTILKFIKSMSCILELLKHLQSAEILEFLVLLLKEHTPTNDDNYKDFINIICPVIYNYCYLNHTRETELVKLGALPYLKDLTKINLPFRQFILPIMCELVYCNKLVKNHLMKNNILEVYLNLLLDPYWQANALDSILNWIKQDHRNHILNNSRTLDCLITGFTLNKVSNLESALDNYLKLVTANSEVCNTFINPTIIENIGLKLSTTMRNSVIQLTLLRILKVLVQQNTSVNLHPIKSILMTLESRKNSLLVDELANEIVSAIN